MNKWERAHRRYRRDVGCMMMEHISSIHRKLLEAGYKFTDQHERILRVLLDHNKSCLSAEEVFMLVRRNDAKIGLATVYRTLDLFCQLRILKKIHLNDQLIRYELRLGAQPSLGLRLMWSCYND